MRREGFLEQERITDEYAHSQPVMIGSRRRSKCRFLSGSWQEGSAKRHRGSTSLKFASATGLALMKLAGAFGT